MYTTLDILSSFRTVTTRFRPINQINLPDLRRDKLISRKIYEKNSLKLPHRLHRGIILIQHRCNTSPAPFTRDRASSPVNSGVSFIYVSSSNNMYRHRAPNEHSSQFAHSACKLEKTRFRRLLLVLWDMLIFKQKTTSLKKLEKSSAVPAIHTFC